MSLGGVPVRILVNKDRLAGITVVVQERKRERREERREREREWSRARAEIEQRS